MRKPDKNQTANLLILFALFSLSGWYLWDSWRASSHIYNLIFVLPLTVTIMALCTLAFIRDLVTPAVFAKNREEGKAGEGAQSRRKEEKEKMEEKADGEDAGSLQVILLFIIYVITLPWLGFDVGTFLFLAAFLRLAGEAKWPWVLGYSLVFSFGSALFFSYMLPYPMPLLLLPGGN